MFKKFIKAGIIIKSFIIGVPVLLISVCIIFLLIIDSEPTTIEYKLNNPIITDVEALEVEEKYVPKIGEKADLRLIERIDIRNNPTGGYIKELLTIYRDNQNGKVSNHDNSFSLNGLLKLHYVESGAYSTKIIPGRVPWSFLNISDGKVDWDINIPGKTLKTHPQSTTTNTDSMVGYYQIYGVRADNFSKNKYYSNMLKTNIDDIKHLPSQIVYVNDNYDKIRKINFRYVEEEFDIAEAYYGLYHNAGATGAVSEITGMYSNYEDNRGDILANIHVGSVSNEFMSICDEIKNKVDKNIVTNLFENGNRDVLKLFIEFSLILNGNWYMPENNFDAMVSTPTMSKCIVRAYNLASNKNFKTIEEVKENMLSKHKLKEPFEVMNIEHNTRKSYAGIYARCNVDEEGNLLTNRSTSGSGWAYNCKVGYTAANNKSGFFFRQPSGNTVDSGIKGVNRELIPSFSFETIEFITIFLLVDADRLYANLLQVAGVPGINLDNKGTYMLLDNVYEDESMFGESIDFEWPVPNKYNTSSAWGIRQSNSNFHHGFDIPGEEGKSDIVAVVGGTVIENTYTDSYGNYIIIETNHPIYGKFKIRYGHMFTPSKYKKGSSVKVKSILGKIGDTGNSSGPHLHMSLQVNKKQLYEWLEPVMDTNISGLLNTIPSKTQEVQIDPLPYFKYDDAIKIKVENGSQMGVIVYDTELKKIRYWNRKAGVGMKPKEGEFSDRIFYNTLSSDKVTKNGKTTYRVGIDQGLGRFKVLSIGYNN